MATADRGNVRERSGKTGGWDRTALWQDWMLTLGGDRDGEDAPSLAYRYAISGTPRPDVSALAEGAHLVAIEWGKALAVQVVSAARSRSATDARPAQPDLTMEMN